MKRTASSSVRRSIYTFVHTVINQCFQGIAKNLGEIKDRTESVDKTATTAKHA